MNNEIRDGIRNCVMSITINNDFVLRPIKEDGTEKVEITTMYHGLCADVIEVFDTFDEVDEGLRINFNYDDDDIRIVKRAFNSMLRKAKSLEEGI